MASPNNVTATPHTSGGSALAPPAATCPLNGYYRDVVNNLNNPGTDSTGICPGESSVYGVHTAIGGIYNPASSGAISSIDFQIDYECLASTAPIACQQNGQAFGPALLQNSHYYVANKSGSATGITAGWVRYFKLSLQATDFNEISPTTSTTGAVSFNIDNTSHPKFSETDPPIQCGFYTFNATPGAKYSIDVGYDNWACTITPAGILKVCKVAGPGIAVGTPFSFAAGPGIASTPSGFAAVGPTLSIPAGAAPGGTCAVVSQSYPLGATVSVTEIIPPNSNDAISNIAVAPPGILEGKDLPSGTAFVTIGSGVTEVTFTNYHTTGYLEVCKSGVGSGTFTVNPGGLGPFVVAAGTCSPAIQVNTGTATIKEAPISGIAMSVCTTFPSNRQQGTCNTTQTSTVTIVPGDISTQTIATITNAGVIPPRQNQQ